MCTNDVLKKKKKESCLFCCSLWREWGRERFDFKIKRSKDAPYVILDLIRQNQICCLDAKITILNNMSDSICYAS